MPEAAGTAVMNREEEGTEVTARLHKENSGIPALRTGVVPGKQADTEGTTDLQEDARRSPHYRLILGSGDTLFDYFSGNEDLKNKKVRFAGHAKRRLQELSLQLLQYSWFHGTMTDKPGDHDSETPEATASNAKGLAGLLGRGFGRAWKKFTGNHADHFVHLVYDLDEAPYTG